MKQQLLLFLSLLSVAIGQSQNFNDGKLQFSVVDVTKGYVSVKKFNNVCPIDDLVIPKNVTHDGISYLVTRITKDAFRDCAGMTSITLPDSITSIGDGAFINCSALTTISIPEGVTSLPNLAFGYCSFLTTINLPDSLMSIGDSAFYGCTKLGNISIPSGVTSIGSSAFGECKALTNIVLPDGITNIDDNMFISCHSLESVNVPDGVTNFGTNAFLGCQSLKSIDIPSSVASIGDFAFEGCTSLESVTVHWDSPLSINASVFRAVDISTIPLFVPTGTETEYQTATIWKDFDWTRLSITEVVTGVALRLYPNPVAEYLNIELSAANELKQITIYNNRGQLVSKEEKSKIDVSKYSRGLYIAQIETTKGKVAKKFIVQ